MKETLEELVEQRRGYKYLTKDGKSPYQNYKYDLKCRKQLKTHLNPNPECNCGEGWSLATLKWIANNCMKLDGIIVEYEIPKKAKIVVPENSDGKFRTDIIKIKKVHSVESLFPALKDINRRLKDYKPVNPITAEKMPPKSEIKKIMAQVEDQVLAQIRNQAWDQIWDQIWDQVVAQIKNQIRAQIRNQIRAQVGDQVGNRIWAQACNQVWNQVWNQVGAQVWNQVGAQVWVCAYHAVKEFFNLDCDHPAFGLVRLGIMVVSVSGKFKVFGINGKFLGEFE